MKFITFVEYVEERRGVIVRRRRSIQGVRVRGVGLSRIEIHGDELGVKGLNAGVLKVRTTRFRGVS